MLEQWKSTGVVMTGPDVGVANNCLNCTFETRNVNDSSSNDGIMTGFPQHIIPRFDGNVSNRDPTLNQQPPSYLTLPRCRRRIKSDISKFTSV